MNHSTPDPGDALLAAGASCWRVETAGRFAVLMENDEYFRALASSLASLGLRLNRLPI